MNDRFPAELSKWRLRVAQLNPLLWASLAASLVVLLIVGADYLMRLIHYPGRHRNPLLLPGVILFLWRNPTGFAVIWVSAAVWAIFTWIVVFVGLCLLKWLVVGSDMPHTPKGFCRKCGYNLTANMSGVCPECGTPLDREIDVAAEP